MLGLLTALVLVVHGYHPFADDAGIYIAGIRKLIDPSLYRPDAPFVLAHTGLSIFAHAIAAFLRVTHLNLPWTLLVLYLFAASLYLFAAWQLAARLMISRVARYGALLMAAALYTLPIAGTALTLMDPYLTARSFSTPLSLLALAAALDRSTLRTALYLALAALLHPLMAAYAIAFTVVFVAFDRRSPRLALGLCAAGFLAAGVAWAFARRLPASPSYREALLLPAHTFLFLDRWQPWEIAGAVLPLLLYALAARKLAPESPIRSLALAAIATGTTSLLIAALFVPATGPYLLVPLQVMRIDHMIYLVGTLLLGGYLAHRLRRRRALAAALCVALFVAMGWVARSNYASSNAIEWPGVAPRNPWQQAFLWIRANTPADALFAFNPRLVYAPGEDAQGFRVESERSQLADDKDAGVIAVFPRLASLWALQRNATLGIDTASDAVRLQRLAPFGVTWILLSPTAATHLPCPFRNRSVQVCRVLAARAHAPAAQDGQGKSGQRAVGGTGRPGTRACGARSSRG